MLNSFANGASSSLRRKSSKSILQSPAPEALLPKLKKLFSRRPKVSFIKISFIKTPAECRFFAASLFLGIGGRAVSPRGSFLPRCFYLRAQACGFIKFDCGITVSNLIQSYQIFLYLSNFKTRIYY